MAVYVDVLPWVKNPNPPVCPANIRKSLILELILLLLVECSNKICLELSLVLKVKPLLLILVIYTRGII